MSILNQLKADLLAGLSIEPETSPAVPTVGLSRFEIAKLAGKSKPTGATNDHCQLTAASHHAFTDDHREWGWIEAAELIAFENHVSTHEDFKPKKRKSDEAPKATRRVGRHPGGTFSLDYGRSAG